MHYKENIRRILHSIYHEFLSNGYVIIFPSLKSIIYSSTTKSARNVQVNNSFDPDNNDIIESSITLLIMILHYGVMHIINDITLKQWVSISVVI